MEVEIISVTDSPGKFIIYRPRTGLAFTGNRAMAQLAQQLAGGSSEVALSDEIGAFLQAIDFFAPDPPPPGEVGGAFRPTTAVLLMTNQCQLRCTYCYAAAGEAQRENLTVEQGQAAIDYVYQIALEEGWSSFDVAFHGGGEPTFAWSVLKACTEYARQKPLKTRVSLTSNGVWSHQQCEWVIHNMDSLSLSLDGSPQTQDDQRPMLTGKRSSDFVMRTVAELDRHQFPYGIRMTATAPWDRLPRDVRFLVENTGCQTIQVEPAFNTQRGGHGDIPEDGAEAFVSAYLEAFDIARKAGKRLNYSGARLGTVTTTFCTAPYQALIVNSNGHLVTCYEVASPTHALSNVSIIGSVEDGAIKVDDTARNFLHGLMADRRTQCRDCFCYWSCAGDCYARVFHDSPGGHLIRGQRCSMNRSLTEQLLLREIADGGVRRAEAPMPAPFSGMTPEPNP